MIRILLVDDEPLAREDLLRLLSQNPDCQMVGFAQNGREALEEIHKQKPDVVFLDIEMPGKNGLEVASDLAKIKDPPLIIFVTAFNQYAVQAFEANAIDYILKPPDPDRVQKAIERIKQRLKEGPQNLVRLETSLIERGLLKRLTAHKANSRDRIVLNPADVYYFHVRLTDVVARTESEDLIVNYSLKKLNQELDPELFVQTHKSYLVNVSKIQKVSPMFSGNFEITLKHPNQLKIPLSRRHTSGLKSRLGDW